jgi:ComF family protein
MIGTLVRGMFSILVPALCTVCARHLTGVDRWLCSDCRRELVDLFSPGRRLVRFSKGKDLIVRYAFRYHPLISRLITEMKYGDKPGIAGLLAPFVLPVLGGWLSAETVLVPVPMHPSRRRERGYNQSELLGVRLSRSTGLRSRPDLLVKRRNTPSQTALEQEERLRSVTGSICIREAEDLGGMRLVLLDDVVTTGSTLRECAAAVSNLGSEEICACAVASS